MALNTVALCLKGGVNLAIFEPDLFKCMETKVYDIISIDYKYRAL